MKSLSAVLLSLVSLSAQAASFDCARPKTPLEAAICNSPILYAADTTMGALYEGALDAAAALDKDKLQAEQQAWNRQLLGCSPGPGIPDITNCVLLAEDTRISQLQSVPIRLNGITILRHSISLTAPATKKKARNENDEDDSSLEPGTLKASWPYTSSGSPEWQAWNAGVQAAVQKRASGAKPKAARTWRSSWAKGSNAELTAVVEYMGHELVTTMIDWTGTETGAAHGQKIQTHFNWLLKSKRELTPEDVFREESGWRQFIETSSGNDLRAELAQNQEGVPDSKDLEFLSEQVHKIENWHFDGRGLTISYQMGWRVCSTCTLGPFTLTWSDLRPFLNPEFEIPPDDYYSPSWF